MGTYRSAQAFVVVRHTSGVDNLYFSDETGTFYSLSLDNIVLDVNSGLDLDLVSLTIPYCDCLLSYMYVML